MKKNKLGGRSFCITGTLSKTRNEFHKIIEDNGGVVAKGVSGKLNYLVVGEDYGSKLDKAESLGVKTIDEKTFLKMIK